MRWMTWRVPVHYVVDDVTSTGTQRDYVVNDVVSGTNASPPELRLDGGVVPRRQRLQKVKDGATAAAGKREAHGGALQAADDLALGPGR